MRQANVAESRITPMPDFEVVAPFRPTGDQPEAIEQLVHGVQQGERFQTLLGVTGSGKTFTVANLVQAVQKPTLVLAPNKTLAAQLYSEYKEFFPNNAVEYFVSYYDYYQPEAYIPRTDTYVEKESQTNDEIEKLRLSATRSLFSRRDVLIVASVSCIYGLGSPEEWNETMVSVKVGEVRKRDHLLRHLTNIQYERNDQNFVRGKFRVRGDVVEVFPSYDDIAVRIEFFGDEVERIVVIDPLTGAILGKQQRLDIFPAKHWVMSQERITDAIGKIEIELEERLDVLNREGKILEAARLKQRTNFDVEMLRETGICSGIENYSRHLAGRGPGDPPWTLLDYLPDDFLLVVDESHVALPQVGGMFKGDRSRKQVLVDYGFRLPSAMDNRPLTYEEFEQHISQAVFVSATPGPYERKNSVHIVEQLIRPTGIIDPAISVRPTEGQIDDLLAEIRARTEHGQRALVTTLTKKMAEDLADYLQEMGIKVHYLHSEIETIERIEILRDLRLGVYDVVVGINLLREGLDLPEVSLVAILDADKEGFLRSEGSLIQTMGRAARHLEGFVIMYADRVTNSMQRAFEETNRRREVQVRYNEEHHITPVSVKKEIRDLSDRIRSSADGQAPESAEVAVARLSREEANRLIKDLEAEMRRASKALEFEKAAGLRDQIVTIRRSMVDFA
jgi:excinuclease ABC subunit B